MTWTRIRCTYPGTPLPKAEVTFPLPREWGDAVTADQKILGLIASRACFEIPQEGDVPLPFHAETVREVVGARVASFSSEGGGAPPTSRPVRGSRSGASRHAPGAIPSDRP